ncbi:hypothetical protein AAHH80_36735, partial [Burkholderia pseudomallei]
MQANNTNMNTTNHHTITTIQSNPYTNNPANPTHEKPHPSPQPTETLPNPNVPNPTRLEGTFALYK